MGCLYSLDFPNGKKYIGITVGTAESRFAKHSSLAGSSTYAVHRAIKKYGDSVQVKTLAVSNDWDYLCHVEKRAISVYQTRGGLGYNRTDGGDGFRGRHTPEAKIKMSASMRGHTHTPEAKAKIGAASKGNKHCLGVKHTAETLEKRSAASKRMSSATRAKIGAASKGNTYRKGGTRSEQELSNFRDSMLKNPDRGVCFNKRHGAWLARITVDHVTRYLGEFKNKEDAVTARQKAVAEYLAGRT